LRRYGQTVNEALDAIFGADIDWLFWGAMLPRPDSAWLGHIPFAHWLVGAVRARSIVELGVFRGASYAAFCDATARFGFETRCYAVDTWVGDSHSGKYGEDVYADLASFNAAYFASFSTLMRMSFDEALPHFADGSIDLLHIDGFHTYEAVRHDFESWAPKLSDRAIVLFHDVAERRDDFGVWKLWEELRRDYPGSEFEHSHGLGVLQVGKAYDGPALALFQTTDPAEIAKIRTRFVVLGDAVRTFARATQLYSEVEQLKLLQQRGVQAGD
jgi:methyltransferase family protein